jgi:hypothetical protein
VQVCFGYGDSYPFDKPSKVIDRTDSLHQPRRRSANVRKVAGFSSIAGGSLERIGFDGVCGAGVSG